MEEEEMKQREWQVKKGRRISKENNTSNSRRHSMSYIRSFRDESSRSFTSHFTLSSAASSPGYPFKDEINPSTYSFTTALKALQAKQGYVWDWLSPEGGYALNSKWDEAERYICNPLSGEVPLQCLSSKSLSSFMASRVTISAPLLFSSSSFSSRKNPIFVTKEVKAKDPVPEHLGQEEKNEESKTKDVGTQSAPPEQEISIKHCQVEEPKLEFKPLPENKEEEEEDTKTSIINVQKQKQSNLCCSSRALSLRGWICWMRKRLREKHKPTVTD